MLLLVPVHYTGSEVLDRVAQVNSTKRQETTAQFPPAAAETSIMALIRKHTLTYTLSTPCPYRVDMHATAAAHLLRAIFMGGSSSHTDAVTS